MPKDLKSLLRSLLWIPAFMRVAQLIGRLTVPVDDKKWNKRGRLSYQHSSLGRPDPDMTRLFGVSDGPEYEISRLRPENILEMVKNKLILIFGTALETTRRIVV